MLSQPLYATAPLAGYRQTINGTLAQEIEHFSLIAISIPDGGHESLNAALESHWQLSLPETGTCIRSSDRAFAQNSSSLVLFGMQTDQCLLVSTAASAFEQDPFEHVQQLLGDAAYLTDQSDSYAALDIQGPTVLKAMERICTLDLETFTASTVARTAMEHLSVIVERPENDRLRLYSPRSSASSFLHAVTTSLALGY